MSDTIALRLRDHGISCRVETRDRLAIVIPDTGNDGAELNRDTRSLLLQLLRAEGFTHVALELDPGHKCRDGAALPGD